MVLQMTQGILSDSTILESVNDGSIVIDPFRPEQLNPSSYDVTLGNEVSVYADVVTTRWDSIWSIDRNRSIDGSNLCPNTNSPILDIKKPLRVKKFTMDPALGWVLYPGIGYLMSTAERIGSNRYVPILDGKSTIGRLFVAAHITAGFGDVGFFGNFTLEVTCVHPIRLYPGMRIGQIRFQTVAGEVSKTYEQTGKYKGEMATGPVPSQAYRMFDQK